jgi:hypothetical protein
MKKEFLKNIILKFYIIFMNSIKAIKINFKILRIIFLNFQIPKLKLI